MQAIDENVQKTELLYNAHEIENLESLENNLAKSSIFKS